MPALSKIVAHDSVGSAQADLRSWTYKAATAIGGLHSCIDRHDSSGLSEVAGWGWPPGASRAEYLWQKIMHVASLSLQSLPVALEIIQETELTAFVQPQGVRSFF
jgi:hypothetical protein